MIIRTEEGKGVKELPKSVEEILETIGNF